MSTFLPASEILTRIGAASWESVPDTIAKTFPCPLGPPSQTTLRSVFYMVSGPPDRRVVGPPSYVVELNGIDGRIIRSARCSAADVGATPPLPVLRGAGIDPAMRVEEYLRRSDRMSALAAGVWQAFSTGQRSGAGAAEFLSTLRSITDAYEASLMVAASPAFFRWLDHATGA